MNVVFIDGHAAPVPLRTDSLSKVRISDP